MGIGQKWPSEQHTYTDADTWVSVTRLTGWRANHNHLYFTNNSYYDNNTKLVICGDRNNANNYFSVDLITGEITQLTDLPVPDYPEHYRLYEGIVDPVRNILFFFAAETLYMLKLLSYEMTALYTLPKGFRHHVVSCSADSDYVFTSIYECGDTSTEVDLTDVWNRHPLSRILRINSVTGQIECIHEEHNFIAHVNVSPVNDTRLTFCHEGNWNVVDHRIWGLDTETGNVWKIHPIPVGDNQGHEYWYQDGIHIGYHGHKADGSCIMGRIRWDNTENTETAFPYRTGHIFSADESLICGDGGPGSKYLRLWKYTENGYEEGRALCSHLCTFKTQAAHVHPRFNPDRKQILFTSDRTGYNQVYLAKLPDDLSGLPLISHLKDSYY